MAWCRHRKDHVGTCEEFQQNRFLPLAASISHFSFQDKEEGSEWFNGQEKGQMFFSTYFVDPSTSDGFLTYNGVLVKQLLTSSRVVKTKDGFC